MTRRSAYLGACLALATLPWWGPFAASAGSRMAVAGRARCVATDEVRTPFGATRACGAWEADRRGDDAPLS